MTFLELIIQQLHWEMILFFYGLLNHHKYEWEQDMQWKMEFTNGKEEDIIVFKKCKKCGAKLATIAGFRWVQIKSYFEMLVLIIFWERGRLESDDCIKWMLDSKDEVIIEKCLNNKDKTAQSMLEYMKKKKV